MAVRFEAAGAAPVGHLARPAEITGQPYTRIAWFRFDDDEVPGDCTLWNLQSEDASQYDDPETIGGNAVRIYSQSGNTDSSTNVWSDATWHQFAFVRSGNTRTLYRLDVNGVVVLATRSAADPLTIAEENLLGYSTEVYSRGRAVEHEKCWNAALTVEELAREAQQFAPVRTTNLQGWSKLKVHTDLSDEVGGSWTAVGVTPSTVAGPTGIVEEWTGARVASSATTAATTSSGGLSCNLPSGITAGDLLMAFAANDTSVSWSAGGDWSLIDNGANGTAVQGACWAKIAAGSDTLTITGEANDIAVVVVRIPAAEHGVTDVTAITKGAAATGTNSAPSGPNCNPGTSGKYLWLTYFASDDDDNTTYWWPVEAAPISQTKSATGTSSCMVGVAYRWLEASSYNPSTFLLAASEEWRAQTFAIPASTGSATYDEDAADSGALTDASATMMLLVGSASDSGVLTDTASGQRVSGDAVSDSGALTDTAAGGLALAASVSDSGALTDTATGAVSAAEVVSDSVAGLDAAASTWVVGESVTDAAESSDSVVVTAVYQEVVSDTLSATESVVESVGGHSYFESVEDALEASDSTLATLLSFGASVRSQGGGSGGGRLWTRDLDDEIEAEMGAILKGPPLTSEVIEEITARLDSPPQTRIMEHRRPTKAAYSPPILDFQAIQARKRRNRQRLLLLL